MAIEKFTFLDEVGIQKLSEALLSKVNTRIAERIVQEVNDASDGNHVASAAVLNALLKAKDAAIAANTTAIGANTTAIGEAKTSVTELGKKVDANKTAIDTATTDLAALSTKVDGLTHLTIDTVTGAIDTVADPSTSILYLQRDDENDKTWMLYIYREDGTWVNIGDTEVDLSNYWSKDDVDAMKEALGVPEMVSMTEAQITTAVEAAFKETDFFNPPLTGIAFDKSVDKTSVNVGATLKLTVNPVPAASKVTAMTFESSDAGVLTVAADGTITGVSAGTAKVTATVTDKGFTDSVDITVYAKRSVLMDQVGDQGGVEGSGSYFPGETVTIKSGTPEANKKFGWWTTPADGVTFANNTASETTFVMPAGTGDVIITANWESAHAVTVTGGMIKSINNVPLETPSASAFAFENDILDIGYTDKDGVSFVEWTATPDGMVTFAPDANQPDVKVTMGDGDVTIEATTGAVQNF